MLLGRLLLRVDQAPQLLQAVPRTTAHTGQAVITCLHLGLGLGYSKCFLAGCCSWWFRRRSSSRWSTDHCAKGFRITDF